MTRETFDRQLKDLYDDLLAMGTLVEKAIEKSLQALAKRNTELAQQVVDEDTNINRARWAIEEKCLVLIATQQPMASDLRTITAILSMVADIERMGDHAVCCPRAKSLAAMLRTRTMATSTRDPAHA